MHDRFDQPPRRGAVKIVLLASLFLALGIGAGVWSSIASMSGETLPTGPYLEYLRARNNKGPATGPRLEVVGGETHDFGSMDLWGKGKHDFVVRNGGRENLKITLGETTCSCFSSELLEKGDSLWVEPGQEKVLTLQWEIKSSMERYGQKADFSTNDPLRSQFTLAIVGRIEESIRRQRSQFTFSNVPSSTSVVQSLDLSTNQTDRLEVKSHRWTKPHLAEFFEVRFEPMTSGALAKEGRKSGISVIVTLKPGMPLGTIDQGLELTTNLAPAVPPLTIPVQGSITGDITLIGPGVTSSLRTVDLGDVKQNVGLKRQVSLVLKGPHRDTTQIQVARAEPSSLQVSLGEALRPNENVRIYPLVIEVPTGAALGAYNRANEGRTGRIILKTTHPDLPEYDLTVIFVVRE